MDFDSPVESLEDIWRIFEKLLNEVLSNLAARNHGVRRLRMIFKPDRGWGLQTITRHISLSRPHRDLSTLLSLIRCESERVDCEYGFVRFQLDVPSHEPIAEAQTQLFEQQAVEEEMECDRLLQRLRVPWEKRPSSARSWSNRMCLSARGNHAKTKRPWPRFPNYRRGR